MKAALSEQQSLTDASFRDDDEADDDLMVARLLPRYDFTYEPGHTAIDARHAAFFAPRRPFEPVTLAPREVAGRFFLSGREHTDSEARPETKTREQT